MSLLSQRYILHAKVNIHNPRSSLQISLTAVKQYENPDPQPFQPVVVLNPDYAVDTYCGLKNLAVPPWRDFPILLLNIFTNMPSAQNRSNFSFR
jgi:hypothetical protein